MNRFYKIFFIAIATIVFLPLLGLVLFSAASMFVNNIALDRFAEQIQNMPHPEGTKRISVYKNVGIYTGNGDHCDFLVVELRRYDPALHNNLEEFYDDVAPEDYIEGSYESGSPPYAPSSDLIIPSTENERWYSEETEDWYKKVSESLDPSTLYVVEHTQYYSDAGLDLRCL